MLTAEEQATRKWFKERLVALREDLAAALAREDELKVQLEAANAFKTYVHARLDDVGVPVNPDSDGNAKHGCRIGGRLTWLLKAAEWVS